MRSARVDARQLRVEGLEHKMRIWLGESMTEGTRDITLEYLRRFDAKLDRVIDDLRSIRVRMTGVEEGLAGVNRRLDRMEMRLDHVETRLGLTDSPI